jgi:hypothetical protein
MTRVERRTSFARTPEEIFDFLADPRHEPAYNPSSDHTGQLSDHRALVVRLPGAWRAPPPRAARRVGRVVGWSRGSGQT